MLITQDIREDNSIGVISAEELVEKMPHSCRTIIIPNLYSVNLFFPQIKKSNDYSKKHIENIDIEDSKRIYELKWESGFLECNDKYIQEILDGKSTESEVLAKMKDVNLIPSDVIKQHFEEEISKIKVREQKCDVIISDYILDNYKIQQTFYDPQHPTEKVICEIGRRILKELGVTLDFEIDIEPILNDTELFIYDCVKNALGLKYSQEFIRIGKPHSTLLREGGVTRGEYISDIVKWSSEG